MTRSPRRPSPALVVAVIALFVALAGVAVALENNAVKSRHIAPGQVKNSDLQDDAVTAVKIADGQVEQAELGADAVTAPKIADGEVGPAELGAVPAVRSQSPSESFNNDQIFETGGSPQPILYDEDIYDPSGMHTGGTYDAEQSKFFAPRAGIYAVEAGLIFSDPGANYGDGRQIYLVKNGGADARDYIAAEQFEPRQPGATIVNVAGTVRLEQGGYVQAYAVHDAASNLVAPQSQFGGVGDGRHFFSMTWLGP